MPESAFFSVIIPTCHRNDLLAICLDRLATELTGTSGSDYEVIVTDDGIAFDARQMIAEHYPFANWVGGPHRGPAANRNNGARTARGDWLVFVDDDCVPTKNWLSSLAHVAHQGAYDVLEGKTVGPIDDSPFRYYVENLNGGSYWSCNLAIRRDIFMRMKGFDEDFLEAGGEDMEFAYRIKQMGLRTHFISEAEVFHPARQMTLNSLIWRTFLMRWKLLYNLKTGQTLPLDESRTFVLLNSLRQSIEELLRTTWQIVRNGSRGRFRNMIFFQLWKWLTFPIVVPYAMVWEMRFRESLRQKADQKTEGTMSLF